jgi:hypothetical protein
LRLLEASADGDVLRNLHKELGADHPEDWRTQLLHRVLDARALAEGLELDEDAGGIFARVAAGAPAKLASPVTAGFVNVVFEISS